jgi:hypothetical protein
MAYKDKEKRNEYQRNLMRRRRSAANPNHSLVDSEGKTLKEYNLKTAAQLREILESTLDELQRNKEVDIAIKMKAVTGAIKVAAELLKVTDLDKRVRELEDKAKEKTEGSWKDSQF